MIPMRTFMTSTTVRERDERVTRTVLTDPLPAEFTVLTVADW
jgi:hypothetical protein